MNQYTCKSNETCENDLIRCKNCKNCVDIGANHFCNIKYNEWGQLYLVQLDGFCSDGERKDTD